MTPEMIWNRIAAFEKSEYPDEAAAKNCQAEVEDLLGRLKGVKPSTAHKIRLLCLTWEIETWLIADDRAVRAHLSTAAHKSKFKCKTPLDKHDAKAFLDGECKKHRGDYCGYVDVREAIKLSQLIPDTNKVRKVHSFKRFANLVCGNPLADFQQCGDVCDNLVYQAHQLGRR
ncbi:MAG: hypothetical protein WCK89_08385 [bacterium]